MTDEEKRIAIAKACGWKVWKGTTCLMGLPAKTFDEPITGIVLPDYLTDLNAMHEAEKTLGVEECKVYHGWLVSLSNFNPAGLLDVLTWHASSARRAEAFLLTKGLLK